MRVSFVYMTFSNIVHLGKWIHLVDFPTFFSKGGYFEDFLFALRAPLDISSALKG